MNTLIALDLDKPAIEIATLEVRNADPMASERPFSAEAVR
jgi:hypothetical protein